MSDVFDRMNMKENAYTIADLPEIQNVVGATNTLRWQADRIEEQAAEIERLREALRIIAGEQQCIDNLMSNVDIARAALEKDETE